MQAHEVRCPSCFAPIAPTDGGVSLCRYCGATIAIQGGAPAPAPERLAVDTPVFLEDHGPNKIAVIHVIREHVKCGLKDAMDLAEGAPRVVAEWPSDPLRTVLFKQALARAGARVR